MIIRTLSYQGSKLFNIVLIYTIRIRQDFSHQFWHDNFVNSTIRIWGDYSATSEVDTLTRQVLAETTMFAFNSLTESSD